MPVQVDDDLAVLEGVVTVEEAEGLAGWARSTAAPRVDLSACTHLHTAALQALLGTRARLEGPVHDPFLARWVAPLLSASVEDA